MLNITCFSLTCLQMYLGVGGITVRASNGFLYQGPRTTFFCEGSSGIYRCLDLINGWKAAQLEFERRTGLF